MMTHLQEMKTSDRHHEEPGFRKQQLEKDNVTSDMFFFYFKKRKIYINLKMNEDDCDVSANVF